MGFEPMCPKWTEDHCRPCKVSKRLLALSNLTVLLNLRNGQAMRPRHYKRNKG